MTKQAYYKHLRSLGNFPAMDQQCLLLLTYPTTVFGAAPLNRSAAATASRSAQYGK